MGILKKVKKILGIKKKYTPRITDEMRERAKERAELNHEIKKREYALKVRKLDLKEKQMDLEEARIEDEISEYEQPEDLPLDLVDSDDPETEVLKSVLRGIAQNVKQPSTKERGSPKHIEPHIMVSKGNTQDFESFKREMKE